MSSLAPSASPSPELRARRAPPRARHRNAPTRLARCGAVAAPRARARPITSTSSGSGSHGRLAGTLLRHPQTERCAPTIPTHRHTAVPHPRQQRTTTAPSVWWMVPWTDMRAMRRLAPRTVVCSRPAPPAQVTASKPAVSPPRAVLSALAVTGPLLLECAARRPPCVRPASPVRRARWGGSSERQARVRLHKPKPAGVGPHLPHRSPRARHRTLGARHKTPNTQHRAPDSKHQASPPAFP